jgi:hypothetical protein
MVRRRIHLEWGAARAREDQAKTHVCDFSKFEIQLYEVAQRHSCR